MRHYVVDSPEGWVGQCGAWLKDDDEWLMITSEEHLPTCPKCLEFVQFTLGSKA